MESEIYILNCYSKQYKKEKEYPIVFDASKLKYAIEKMEKAYNNTLSCLTGRTVLKNVFSEKQAYIETSTAVYKWDLLEYKLVDDPKAKEVYCCVCNESVEDYIYYYIIPEDSDNVDKKKL